MAVFYKVTCPSNQFTSYLMGTFHLNHPVFTPLLAQAEDLIKSTSCYFGEMDLTQVDPTRIIAIQKKLPKPGPKVLRLLEKRQPYFEKHGLSYPAYPEQTSSFSLLNELTFRLWKQELSTGSIDEELLKIALRSGKTLGGIESFERQLEIMEKLDHREIERQIIRMLQRPKIFSRSMDKLFRYYLRGKTRKLGKEALKSTQGNKKLMVFKRNKVFTEFISNVCSAQDGNFVSFGAGHLNGRNGVVKGLRKLGFTVGKIKIPTSTSA